MPWIYHPDNESFFFEPVTASSLMRLLYPRPSGRTQRRSFRQLLSYLFRLFLAKPFLSRLIGVFQKSRISKLAVSSFQKQHQKDLPTPAKNPSQFSSFNAYFQRDLGLCYGLRELDDLAKQETSFVSPTDARTLFFTLQKESCKNQEAAWSFKEERFSLSTLLGVSTEEFFALNAQNTSRPSQVICQRLCPFDYHHIHAPIDCKVEKITYFKGPLFSVHPMAIATNAKYFFRNQRVCLRLFSEQLSCSFFLVAIGATAVGSIELLIEQGQKIQKGEKIASFACGGSSVAMAIANSPFDLVHKLALARARAGCGVECFTQCRDTLLVSGDPVRIDRP